MRPDPSGRVLRIVVLFTLVLLAVVVVTGAYLVFFYSPTVAHLSAQSRGGADRAARLAWLVHRIGGWILVPSCIAVALLSVADRRRLRPAGVLSAAGSVPAVLAAALLGVLLPWDQLALWAVTVGKDLRGYRWLFWDRGLVRFVIARGQIVDVSTVAWMLGLHVVLGVLASAALVIVAGRGRASAEGAGGADLGDAGVVPAEHVP